MPAIGGTSRIWPCDIAAMDIHLKKAIMHQLPEMLG
jgi:hypothetical protein